MVNGCMDDGIDGGVDGGCGYEWMEWSGWSGLGFMPDFELQLKTNLLLSIYLPTVWSKLCSFAYICIFCRHIFVVQSNQAGYALLGT